MTFKMQRQINQGKVYSHINVVSAICTVSVKKKMKERKKTRKTNIFSIIEITVRDIFSTLNSYCTKKSTDMFEKYMGKRMGKS